MFPRPLAVAALLLPLLPSCTTPPSFEKMPGVGSGPDPAQITQHITCELASVAALAQAADAASMSTPDAKPDQYLVALQTEINKRPGLKAEIDRDPALTAALGDPNLANLFRYHYVAALTLTLAVTDIQNFNAQLGFNTPFDFSGSRLYTIGGGINGTQDRNVQQSYALDMYELAANYPAFKNRGSNGCTDSDSHNGSLAGYLDLAEVVSDGLRTMHNIENFDQYGSSGASALSAMPLPTMTTSATLAIPGTANIVTFDGALNPAPALGPQVPPQSTALTGTFKDAKGRPVATVNLTGTILAHDANDQPDAQRIVLSGTVGAPTANNPSSETVTLAGKLTYTKSVNHAPRTISSLELSGAGGTPATPPTPATADKPATPGTPGTNYSINLSNFVNHPENLAATTPSTTGASSGAGAGGATSFGGEVDFTLQLGADGGPNWSVTRFKGPGGATTGGGQLLNFSRSTTDTLNITFVATCTDTPPILGEKIGTYWNSLPPCGSAAAAANANAAPQTNTLMMLNNSLRGLGINIP